MARQGKATGSKARITKRAIDDLRSRAKNEGRTLYLRDDELTGFGAVSTKAGASSYFVEYRLGGRGTAQKRMSIGKHGALTPDEARKRAKDELGKVARGADVAQAKKDARLKLTGTTLKDAIERFLASNKRTGRYWVHKEARLLGKDMALLHNRPFASIKRSDMLGVIDKVKVRSEAAARLLFVDLRPFFKWAVERAMIEANPTLEMKPPAAATKRDRVLEDYEVKAFWQATAGMRWPFQSIYRLLLLTGARREEVAGMKWSEIDLDAGVWTLPGAQKTAASIACRSPRKLSPFSTGSESAQSKRDLATKMVISFFRQPAIPRHPVFQRPSAPLMHGCRKSSALNSRSGACMTFAAHVRPEWKISA
jgi:Arm DNA-binding domain